MNTRIRPTTVDNIYKNLLQVKEYLENNKVKGTVSLRNNTKISSTQITVCRTLGIIGKANKKKTTPYRWLQGEPTPTMARLVAEEQFILTNKYAQTMAEKKRGTFQVPIEKLNIPKPKPITEQPEEKGLADHLRKIVGKRDMEIDVINDDVNLKRIEIKNLEISLSHAHKEITKLEEECGKYVQELKKLKQNKGESKLFEIRIFGFTIYKRHEQN